MTNAPLERNESRKQRPWRERLARRFHSLRRRTAQGRGREGFTLIELAVVVLVLGIIMSVVLYNIDFGVKDDAIRLKVNTNSKLLQSKWEMYEFDHAPVEEGNDLMILARKDPENPTWRPVDEDLVLDPWKRPYFICRDDVGERQICSYGQDGEPGGEGKAADFYLTSKNSWPSWLSGAKQQE